jgi:hypothetical protein
MKLDIVFSSEKLKEYEKIVRRNENYLTILNVFYFTEKLDLWESKMI